MLPCCYFTFCWQHDVYSVPLQVKIHKRSWVRLYHASKHNPPVTTLWDHLRIYLEGRLPSEVGLPKILVRYSHNWGFSLFFSLLWKKMPRHKQLEGGNARVSSHLQLMFATPGRAQRQDPGHLVSTKEAEGGLHAGLSAFSSYTVQDLLRRE